MDEQQPIRQAQDNQPQEQPPEPVEEQVSTSSSSLTKILIGIIAGLVVIIAIGVGAYFFTNQYGDFSLTGCTEEAKVCSDGTTVGRIPPLCEFAECPSVTAEEDLNIPADWITYRNEEYGFEFKYPAEWGDVEVKQGNRLREGEIFCGAGSGLTVYGVQESVFLYDTELAFSKSPIKGGFKILKFNLQQPVLWLCNESGENINLLEDTEALENLPLGDSQKENGQTVSTFVNQGEVKIFYYPQWFDSLGSGIDQFYKFYGDTVEIEGGMQYSVYYNSPEAIELDSYSCSGRGKYGLVYGEDCGIAVWVREGKTSEKIRTAFRDFHEVIQTFKFIEPQSSVDTSDWETYRNEELGITFIHPKDWMIITKDDPERTWLSDNLIATTHDNIVDSTPVQIYKYKYVVSDTLELTQKTSQIYNLSKTEIEQITLNGTIVLRRTYYLANNDCTGVEYFYDISNNNTGIVETGFCPTYEEGYNQIRLEIADSVKFIN